MGHSGWSIFFALKKKTNKCQLFRENESNQIVRLFVTNLLLYMWCEVKKKKDKPKKHKGFFILAIQTVLTFEHD